MRYKTTTMSPIPLVSLADDKKYLGANAGIQTTISAPTQSYLAPENVAGKNYFYDNGAHQISGNMGVNKVLSFAGILQPMIINSNAGEPVIIEFSANVQIKNNAGMRISAWIGYQDEAAIPSAGWSPNNINSNAALIPCYQQGLGYASFNTQVLVAPAINALTPTKQIWVGLSVANYGGTEATPIAGVTYTMAARYAINSLPVTTQGI